MITQISELGLNLAGAAKPPVCRDCRWCRPSWWVMAVPIFSLIPAGRRAAWEGAHCRHSSSRDQPRRRSYVLRGTPKSRQLDCDSARMDNDRCGPEARYWQARRISARASMIGLAILGHALAIVYFSYLWGR